ncbi:unnamed protein product [Cuscuta epithymum]|uniref:ZF-HD dimerization-type domain-containing protein n=1 Tax=Cuscuta epithymum TaxID=186058 RepID=A0AAV0D2Y1_9ASTE|nr:unnamed protein product [Cuscuta epithymum]
MPTGEDDTPESLKCAACDCHRNFHRKEIHLRAPPPTDPPPAPTITPQLHQCSWGVVSPAPVTVTLGGNSGVPAESSSADLETVKSRSGSKKRFRTKFTQQQRDQMQGFAEKIGWRIEKEDEEKVQQFCEEVGLKRQVFKVWIHNTKQAEKRK